MSKAKTKKRNLTVQPIRKISDIRKIQKQLLSENKYRDHLFFTIGINSGLRVADLVGLKVGQFKTLKVGDELIVRESKTCKDNFITINDAIRSALDLYFKHSPEAKDSDYLFKSKHGGHIKSQRVSKMVKEWTEKAGLKGFYGTHTLRKTWGYMMRTKFNIPVEVISERYNHATPAITRAYLGIQRSEVQEILMKNIG